MTPKSKAEELLIVEYKKSSDYIKNNIKRKIIKEIDKILSNDNLYPDLFLYYIDVKQEVKKL